MSTDRLKERIDRLQAQRAAQWLEVLQAGKSADKEAFAAWCRESPVHIREFLEASWLHRELTQLEPQGQAAIDELLNDITPHVRTLPVESVGSAATRAKGRLRWIAAAACLSLAIAAALYWQQTDRQYTTHIGEQRTVELSDASVIKLNTDSIVEVNYAPGERLIELKRGEAVFKVAHDATRPFRVHTRRAVVTAVGTQFNIYERPAGTDVTVLEGRVRIVAQSRGGKAEAGPAVELGAGEEARIAPDGSIHRSEHADVQRVTAWSKRRLKFERAALEDIADEFNRYNRTQLRIENIPPTSRFYRGVFDADDPDALVSMLEREPELAVERRRDEILIRRR